jgi:hypothetical protein
MKGDGDFELLKAIDTALKIRCLGLHKGGAQGNEL